MSLILDALKKSDNERKRQSAPSILDVRSAKPEKPTPRWIFWFVGLLAINLIVLLFVLLRSSSPGKQSQVQTIDIPGTEKNAEKNFSTPMVPPPARKQAVRSLANEAAEARAPATRQVTPSNSPVVTPTTSTAGNDREQSAMESFRASDNRDLPTLSQLRANGAISLPELHIDLHVFDAAPSKRLVFINGVKYSEGETISDGPSVHAIRDDGVELRYQGVDFLLQRN